MTWKQKYGQNKKLMALYDAFLPECSEYKDRLKIMTELGRLNTQNIKIRQMKVEQYEEDCYDYEIIR